MSGNSMELSCEMVYFIFWLIADPHSDKQVKDEKLHQSHLYNSQ